MSTTERSLMSHLRVFDRILPVSLQSRPAELQAARHLSLLAAVTALSTPLLNAMYHWLGHDTAGMVVVTAGIGMMVSPFILHWGVGIGVARDLFVGVLFLLKVWMALHFGGLAAPTVPWFLLCPAVAMLLGGIRPGLVWTGAVTLAVVALFVQERMAPLVADPVRDPLVLELVSTLGLFFLVTIIVALARDAIAIERRGR
ncbi:MAG TPA: hypothetical protein VF861_00215 [Telluria sp.]